MSLTVGLDLGNGYVKARLKGTTDTVVSLPSVSVVQRKTNVQKTEEQEISNTITDLENLADMSFSSPLVKDPNTRYLIGNRAMESGNARDEYDIHARKSKATVKLSGVLALGIIAVKALQEKYKEIGTLPTGMIFERVNLAVALPIDDHAEHAKDYRELYLNNGEPHNITFHNFEKPIVVGLRFEHVYVASEGEAAQYALRFSDEQFKSQILAIAKSRYQHNELDGIHADDLVKASSSLGIDIGEGTVDFAVFSGGKRGADGSEVAPARFNREASMTLNQGYGDVIEAALNELESAGFPYKTRKQVSEFLIQNPSALQRAQHRKVQEIVSAHSDEFVQAVKNEISRIFEKVGTFVEVIFVYGGGAGPLEDVLLQEIEETVNHTVPVVYIDAVHSRFLNEQGLFTIAMNL